MISEGDEAPRFELPAVVDGEHRRVALDEYLGEDVVILAFYPGDFNPACDEESDLDELDLFTMQKDVSVLGISADTLYSHAAFAEAYDLHVPLLSDTRREVAREYGVTFEDAVGQALIERAVFVVDHDGVVRYAWSTQSPLALPDVDAIKDTIGDTGGDDTAFARYRVGHAHYTEGRRAFTSAMDGGCPRPALIIPIHLFPLRVRLRRTACAKTWAKKAASRAFGALAVNRATFRVLRTARSPGCSQQRRGARCRSLRRATAL